MSHYLEYSMSYETPKRSTGVPHVFQGAEGAGGSRVSRSEPEEGWLLWSSCCWSLFDPSTGFRRSSCSASSAALHHSSSSGPPAGLRCSSSSDLPDKLGRWSPPSDPSTGLCCSSSCETSDELGCCSPSPEASDEFGCGFPPSGTPDGLRHWPGCGELGRSEPGTPLGCEGDPGAPGVG